MDLNRFARTLVGVGLQFAVELRCGGFTAVAGGGRVVLEGGQAIGLRVERGQAEEGDERAEAHRVLKIS